MSITRRGALALSTAAVLPARAFAAETIAIGNVNALTGNAASAGQAIKQGAELAVDIINAAHPELAPLTLAKDAGLPNLGGAKVRIVWADDEGNPTVAQSVALRLISQDRVVAITGDYQSSCTLTSSAIAERYGIPYVAGESVAANLTERGYKWFFRTTPIAPDFANLYLDFLASVAKSGRPAGKIAVVNENTDYGTSIAEAISKAATARGLRIALVIPYDASSTDVSPQVLRLKKLNPDAVIFISYTSDAILYMKTFDRLGYHPPIVIGDDAGFSDPSFAKAVGPIAQGVLGRSAFVPGKPGTITYKINAMFRARAGRDMDETTARATEGLFVLCDAINRAGSTKPEDIRKALVATNLPADELMLDYKGVKFDAKGQNTLGYSLMMQLRGTEYVPVWPEQWATAKLELPFKGRAT